MSSRIQRNFDAPRLAPLLPLLYVAWADGDLTKTEMKELRRSAEGQAFLDDEARKQLAEWTDPDKPPSPAELRAILRRIHEAASDADETERESLVGLGVALARRDRDASDVDWIDSRTRTALENLERTLGVECGEAAAELMRVGPEQVPPPTVNPPDFDVELMRRLLDGEKLTYDGVYYTTDRARLYSPPVHSLPIYMAAGGPKSAALAARRAEGIITSVKDPDDTFARVIEPAREAARDAGRADPSILASRWTIRAESDDEAWETLGAWRGLRAPGRLEAVDPMDLRMRADEMPRDEILSRYSMVHSPDDYVEVYGPLITDVHADIVAIQTTSTDQEATIDMLGSEVLPRLRDLR